MVNVAPAVFALLVVAVTVLGGAAAVHYSMSDVDQGDAGYDLATDVSDAVVYGAALLSIVVAGIGAVAFAAIAVKGLTGSSYGGGR
ncbi:hypothetical protein [Natrarchaeobaculum sulfurireducens]|nr:hypothetical protein [Natrarchaeobaculum sulfurireducens]